jgi:hypothetical protein
MNSRKLLWCTPLLVAFILVKAQPVRDELVKMNRTYQEASSFSMHLKVSLYGKGQQAPEIVQEGHVQKQGEAYRSEFGGKVTLVNKKEILIIDDNQKLIAYSEVKGRQEKPEQDVSLLLDSGLFKTSTVKLKAKTGTEETIDVIPQYGAYKRIELVVSLTDHTLKSITYYYQMDEEQTFEKMTVVYSEVVIASPIPGAVFSTSSFLVKKGGKLTATGKYSDYKVLDETDLKPFTDEN